MRILFCFRSWTRRGRGDGPRGAAQVLRAPRLAGGDTQQQDIQQTTQPHHGGAGGGGGGDGGGRHCFGGGAAKGELQDGVRSGQSHLRVASTAMCGACV